MCILIMFMWNGIFHAFQRRTKKRAAVVETKPGKICQKSPEHFSLADLSPTTGNVPLPDEYKVEWAKAKAELKRRKSSASSTDKSERTSGASVTTASHLQSTDSSMHSSDSLPCPSESSTQSNESPLHPQLSQTAKIHESGNVPPNIVVSSHQSVNPSCVFSGSPPRPTSLNIIPRKSSVPACYAESQHSVQPQPATRVTKIPLPNNQPNRALNASHISSFTVSGDTSRTAGQEVHRGDRNRVGPCLNLRGQMDDSICETAASDDVKSSAAALKSFFEARQFSGSGDKFSCTAKLEKFTAWDSQVARSLTHGSVKSEGTIQTSSVFNPPETRQVLRTCRMK